MYDDTICAVSTAAGSAGISIIRMSGKQALEIAGKVFFPDHKKKWQPRFMHLGNVRDGEKILDRALGVWFKAPASYTGEDIFELHCHGGFVAANMAMELFIKQGARPAEPGEFTKRAFLNGKMDISAAEAVSDYISALSTKGAQMAARQMTGELAARITDMQSRLTDMLAEIEVGIEYPEEDLESDITKNILPRLTELRREITELHDSFRQGRLLREGIKVALAGRPNVGKSSLLNAIFGEERAIVSEIPGTTRDVISEYYTLHSVPLQFMDTAGIRDTADTLEKMGVARTEAAVAGASVAVIVFDASSPLSEQDTRAFELAKTRGIPLVIALNKTDLPPLITREMIRKKFGCDPVEISALRRTGIPTLLDTIYSLAIGDTELYEGVMITNSRHAFALDVAQKALSDGIAALETGIDLDCVTIDLQSAWHALGEVTGETLSEGIIDRIFEKFCVGK